MLPRCSAPPAGQKFSLQLSQRCTHAPQLPYLSFFYEAPNCAEHCSLPPYCHTAANTRLGRGTDVRESLQHCGVEGLEGRRQGQCQSTETLSWPPHVRTVWQCFRSLSSHPRVLLCMWPLYSLCFHYCCLPNLGFYYFLMCVAMALSWARVG